MGGNRYEYVGEVKSKGPSHVWWSQGLDSLRRTNELGRTPYGDKLENMAQKRYVLSYWNHKRMVRYSIEYYEIEKREEHWDILKADPQNVRLPDYKFEVPE